MKGRKKSERKNKQKKGRKEVVVWENERDERRKGGKNNK
jgi:hypothetical protein